ncbi:MAG: FIST C-terminal domain-containing protein [Nitrospira sp.]|nr:FIST C-terminal domain-containing protein [Nitrospira sp.]MDE0486830.1 FIST C-terminal domain-containing protein [Nitrospira sp.]
MPMQFHVAIARESDAEQAAQALIASVREAFGLTSPDLVCLFFSPHYAKTARELVETLHRQLAPRVMVGCMGDGVIGPAEEYENTSVVTLWTAQLPEVRMAPFHLTFHEQESQSSYTFEGWPQELESLPERPTFLVFADPFSTPIEDVFETMEARCPGAPAIGGVASGGTDLGENRLVFNGGIVQEGLVGVALWGPVWIRTLVSQGCQPIGERYVVTKAERNIMYELGGVPTLERLRETLERLGPERGKQVAMAVQVGVAFDEQREEFGRGDFLIRGLLGADQRSGGVAISDIVKEGQTIQFHVRDPAAASEDFNLLLAQDRLDFPKSPFKGALLFSCNGRGRRFFAEPNHDITALQRRADGIPVAGFFAAGEIGPVGGKNFIHGYTASVALFAEPFPGR